MERGAIDRVGRRPRPTFVRERARAMDARRGRTARGTYPCVLRARPRRPSSVARASSSVASSSGIICRAFLSNPRGIGMDAKTVARARSYLVAAARVVTDDRRLFWFIFCARIVVVVVVVVVVARTARDATDARATRGAAPRRAGARTDRRVTAAPLASVARVIAVIGVVVAYVIVSLERRVRVCGARFDRSIRSSRARAPVAFHVHVHTYIDVQDRLYVSWNEPLV